MPFLFGLETLAIIGLKAVFGKAVVGAAVKTGVGVAGKALLVHDAARVVGHISDAATAVDAVSTAADAADTTATFTSVAGPVGDCGGTLPLDLTGANLPTDVVGTPPGLIIDPSPGVGDCGSGITQTAALTPDGYDVQGVDADRNIHGNDPTNNVHGNPPTDVQGNPTDRGIHGGRPGDVYGPHFK